jgi:hypothetical protein
MYVLFYHNGHNPASGAVGLSFNLDEPSLLCKMEFHIRMNRHSHQLSKPMGMMNEALARLYFYKNGSEGGGLGRSYLKKTHK